MALPLDVAILGTVLALAVAILLLSGLALYIAFRIRETLRDEKGGSARAVKVAFLIGLLFLSGGIFYFFASGFNAVGGGSSTQTSSSVLSSTTSTISISSASSVQGTSTSTTSSTNVGAVSLSSPSCPSRVKAGSTFTCYITVYNQGSTTFSGTTIVSSGDFTKFVFLSCSESVNGGSATTVSTSSNTIALGNLTPGTTVLTLSVQAPAQSGQNNNSILTLNAPGLTQPLSVTFSIQATA